MNDTASGQPARSFRYAVILPHASEQRVLVLPHDGGWVLPSWSTGDQNLWESLYLVNELARDHLGVSTQALRAIHLDHDRERADRTNVYAFEPCEVGWTPPPGARWMCAAELETLELPRPGDRTALALWFAERGTARPTPWYNAGWRAEADAWFTAQARAAGYEPTGEMVPVRAWQRSAVLKLPTAGGDLYFKAVPPMFAHEQQLNLFLEERYPAQAPRTLAYDSVRRWAITRDFGGPPLSDIAEFAVWEDAYQRYAKLQIALRGQLVELRELGCPWRPLAARTHLIKELLHDDELLLLGRPGGLTVEQAGTLRAQVPWLLELWNALAASPIPISLDHGDLWPANMVAADGDILFFDWSDCALTHPFLCFILSGPEAQAAFPDLPDVAERVRRAYLAPWREHLPGIDVDAAFELTWRVGALHYALLYAYDILPNLAPRWELERMVPFYLRIVLERLDDESSCGKIGFPTRTPVPN